MLERNNSLNTTMSKLFSFFKSNDTQSSIEDNDKVKFLHYIEFQSKLMEFFSIVTKKKISTKSAWLKFIHYKDIFVPVDKDCYQSCILWPYENESREIKIMASVNKLKFYYQDHVFLTLSLHSTNEITVKKSQSQLEKGVWCDSDLENIICHFSDVLRPASIHYINNKLNDNVILKLKKNTQYHFDKQAFYKMTKECEHYPFTYRINHCIVKNSNRRNNSFTFYLDWPDDLGQTHLLKAKFYRGDLFHPDYSGGEPYSWVLSERDLLDNLAEYDAANISTGQRYYSFNVYEMTSGKIKSKENCPISVTWMTPDGYCGELYSVKRGSNISGNEVLKIHDFFDANLFKLKTTLICDDSSLQDDSPLRLILALSTGKTWYQTKIPGLCLFECQGFDSQSVSKVTAEMREKMLKQLQALQLSFWYQGTDSEGKVLLKQLYNRHLKNKDSRSIINTEMTVRELVGAVYNESRSSKGVSSDMSMLTDLLCKLEFGEPRINVDANPELATIDEWVAFRVNILLNESRFWVKRRSLEEHSSGEKEERFIAKLD